MKRSPRTTDNLSKIISHVLGAGQLNSRAVVEINPWLVFQVVSDINFIAGIKKSIDLQLRHSDTPIYFYQFSYDEKLGLLEKYIGDSTTPGMKFVVHHMIICYNTANNNNNNNYYYYYYYY